MFNELAKEIHNERVVRNHYDYNKREVNGDNIYLDYCIWCNCSDRVKDKKNMAVFGEWIKREHISLTQKQRQHIAEKHFGVKVVYNYDKNLWEIAK